MKDQCNLMDDPQSSMRCVDMITKDESETNKLLPTMHKIWKYLVVCLRQGRTPVRNLSRSVLTQYPLISSLFVPL